MCTHLHFHTMLELVDLSYVPCVRIYIFSDLHPSLDAMPMTQRATPDETRTERTERNETPSSSID